MITKKKGLLSFYYFKTIVFFFTIIISQVKAETKIIARSGDTLLKISNQYGVSLKELMHKNSFDDASVIVEGKVIIIPIKNINNKNEGLTHKVIKGDTLYKIAIDYNVSIKDIVSINNLDNASFLKTDQIILLPNGATYKKATTQKNNMYRPPFWHLVYGNYTFFVFYVFESWCPMLLLSRRVGRC